MFGDSAVFKEIDRRQIFSELPVNASNMRKPK